MQTLLNGLDPETAKILTDNLIPQILVILAGFGAIYVTVIIGWGHMTWLRGIEQEYFSNIRIARVKAITRPETIKEKLAEIEREKAERLTIAWAHFWSLTLLGILVPSALMLFFSLNYAWFFENQFPLVDQESKLPISNPTLTDGLGFVVSQLTRAPFDFMEIFGLDVSKVGFDPTYRLFAVLVFLYRSLEGAFLGAAGVFLYRVVRFRNSKGESQQILEERLDEAT
jgi:hypothetical protein